MNPFFIASDHRGLALKEELKKIFSEKNWQDLGPFSSAPVDYPDYAEKLCLSLKEAEGGRGVLICSTGQGMSMKANRFPHIRAALCWDEKTAELARLHNDANVLCLSGTLLPFDVGVKIFEAFDKTPFEEGRHKARIQKLGST